MLWRKFTHVCYAIEKREKMKEKPQQPRIFL